MSRRKKKEIKPLTLGELKTILNELNERIQHMYYYDEGSITVKGEEFSGPLESFWGNCTDSIRIFNEYVNEYVSAVNQVSQSTRQRKKRTGQST